MRAFIVVCLVASALAAPQSGYNYQQQQNSFKIQLPNFSGISAASHGAAANSIAQEGQSFLQEALQNTKLSQNLLGAGQQQHQQQQTYSAPAQQNIFQQRPQQQQTFGFSSPSFGGQQNYQPQQQQQQQYQQQQFRPAPVVTKDIYVHVAPEEPEEKYTAAPLPVAPPRKHYRIVFIKAPSQSVNTAALRLKQAPTEEKTIIYVLTKKPDPLDLQAALEDVAPKQPSKPEVFFIKYKTQEEAQHAQRTIQAQYDKLGGTTQISDEGVAPVSSVIGSLDQHQGSAGLTTGSGFSSVAATGSGSSTGSSQYLPPSGRV